MSQRDNVPTGLYKVLVKHIPTVRNQTKILFWKVQAKYIRYFFILQQPPHHLTYTTHSNILVTYFIPVFSFTIYSLPGKELVSVSQNADLVLHMLKETAMSWLPWPRPWPSCLSSADKQVDLNVSMAILRPRPDYEIKQNQISEVIVLAWLECEVQRENVQKDITLTP